jgi:uncharacterized protein (DUF58 family)
MFAILTTPFRWLFRTAFRPFAATYAAFHSLFDALGWRLTREGWLWLLTVAVLLAIGIYKNINLLALLGYVLLALLLLNGVVVGRRLRKLEARRQVDEMVFAGDSCKVELRLRNLSGRARPGVRVLDVGPGHDLAWYLDRLEGHARRRCRGTVVWPRRGRHEFGPVFVTSGHPFGLVERRVVVGEPTDVLVLPRVGRLSRDKLRQQLCGADPYGDRVHRRGWRHDSAQVDFHGLRPFRPGDSPRWIHWRTSARRGELFVREMEDVPGDDLVLVLDASSPCAAQGDLFEEAVTLTATIIHEWCRSRGDRLLFAVAGGSGGTILDGLTGPDHARRLLECLATVEPGPGDPGAILETVSRICPATAGALLVSAGPSTMGQDLESRLSRPVISLDAARHQEWGFYSSKK